MRDILGAAAVLAAITAIILAGDLCACCISLG